MRTGVSAIRSAVLGTALVASAGACASDPAPAPSGGLTAARRHDRLVLIRDTAAQMGLGNAALLGGIAVSETNLAHCWSEATYACMGPTSPSCDGPIIAGSADGPCAAMQGGLGMFQFDAGTWSETLATYGDAILTETGNTAQAVSFVVDQITRDVPGVTGWLAAVGWLNQVPLVTGEAMTEQWAQIMACRYNGCCATSALCTQRADGYRDHAIALVGELGATFWQTADRCTALPPSAGAGSGAGSSAGSVIEPRDPCYLAAGDPRAWHAEAAGYADHREWALTTAAGAPVSFAQWILHPIAGRYHVEVYAAGGAAMASYQVAHGGQTEPISIDQSIATGFVALGDFDFTGEGDEHVELDTTSPTPGAKLVFDALRVTPL
ncbi:MAG TPA: hypothetical protein VH165_25480 [Kofleriaceae bacterium]|nr:hypothetical protein [Kofleriaceae bacterium]